MMPHFGANTQTSAWTTGSFHDHHKATTHMTFFWGHKTKILFNCWPGSSSGMYALALIFVFTLSLIVEWFKYCSIIKPGTNKVAAGFFRTGMRTLLSGLSYMVMLAVMSFNGGIFLAAVGGHAVGFVFFGNRISKNSEKKPDLPSH
ncbi:hypothetical protein P3X46_004941 [Hevea brasiliensis]|uniref:Copper transport protein n=1 Tax=Hevea brasiliensis TaxID=3981 RepID=A0ABQ9N1W2_HEVBR|nr:copper transporter 1 [Hevea brasiliensis]KAJ9185288.1 hypothetical protein P3X46_004941 [Hevea brasiliensis]